MKKSDELKAALVDVRKAYFLLEAYQRRVVNTCKKIGDTFGLQLYQTCYHLGRPPNAGTYFFDRATNQQQLIPLLHTSFLFLSEKALENPNRTRANDWLLDTRIIADTNRIGWNEKTKPERPIEKYGSGDSVLGIVVFQSTEDRDRNWLKVYSKTDWPQPNSVESDRTNAVKKYGESFPLERLLDESAVETELAGFAKRLEKKMGISVELRVSPE